MLFVTSQDVVSLGATISACERALCWQRSILLVNGFALSSLRLNGVACSAAISACEKAQLQLALENMRCARRRTIDFQ